MAKRNQKGGKGAPQPHLRSRTTRSSKGRLIPLEPSPSLPDQLRLLGLYAAPTLGDGNCLFRALADQVHGSPSRHAEVRREVCEWIERWGERYEGFVEFEGEEEEKMGKGKRLEAYLGNMRENGTYGGHMELSAFAHMTRRNIKVVQPGLVYVIEWRAGSGSGSGSGSSSSSSGPSGSGSGSSQTASPIATATAPTSSPSPVSTASTTTPKSTSISISTSTSTPGPSERRRSTRSLSRSSASPTKTRADASADLDAGKQKVKTGHGYYVLEEVSSDEDEDEDEAGAGAGAGAGVEQADVDVDIVEEQAAGVVVPERVEPEPVVKVEPEVKEQRPRERERPRWELEQGEDGGPTIYVAYHDWEHFSSIRNLRGPHTGLPNIQESPAYSHPHPESNTASAPVSTSGLTDKEALKEREREKKRERERKEREREKERRERGALKVKLRVPVPGPGLLSTSSSLSSVLTSPPGTPAPTIPAVAMVAAMAMDPTLIPLPTSRSASPFPAGPSTSFSASASPLGAEAQPHATHNLVQPSQPLHSSRTLAHLHPSASASASAAARAQHRSPKRSFDESSASGGEDNKDTADGREKRSRRRVGSTSGLQARQGAGVGAGLGQGRGEEDMDVDVDVDIDGEADTPGLSAPGSSSSETSSEVASEESSVSPSPPPEAASPPSAPVVAPHDAGTPQTPKAKLKNAQRYHHQHHVQSDKTLTRRERKKLGLPKVRPSPGLSAGKIVIPGGKWTGREVGVAGAGVGEEPDVGAEEEWRRNGTGRLDVRGFRELKI